LTFQFLTIPLARRKIIPGNLVVVVIFGDKCLVYPVGKPNLPLF